MNDEIRETTFYEVLTWKQPHEARHALMENYVRMALDNGAILSLSGLQTFAGMDDVEFAEWNKAAPKMFSWFSVLCRYLNMDRAAKKMLDAKMVSFFLLNEANYISSRSGEKVQGEDGGAVKRKILQLELIEKGGQEEDV